MRPAPAGPVVAVTCQPRSKCDGHRQSSSLRTRAGRSDQSHPDGDSEAETQLADMSGAGGFIRPETVAEDLGISATPVREGLLQLQTEGFLTVELRRGFTVTALSRDDVRDIYDAQALLGGELTARTARGAESALINGAERYPD
jgi:Bacterial regulatory proteins, gntR family